MKKVLFGFLLLFCSVSYAEKEELLEIVLTLDSASKEWLGVSLGAVAFLADARPGTHIPLGYLERSGKLQVIKELEEEKYISTKTIKGLPDGQEPNESFIHIQPTDKGIAVIAAIQAASYNKANQQGPSAGTR